METNIDFNLPLVKSNRTILMIGGPKEIATLSLELHRVLNSKNLEAAREVISDARPDLVIYFAKEKQDSLEEYVMTWLIEGFRGKFIVIDPHNRIKDSDILLESQVLDEYFSGPVSPSRFESIIKSQLTQDLRFAAPRAMTTFDLFRNLFDRGLNAIFFFMEDLQKCVAANLKAEQITGHTLYELRHLGLGDLIPEEHFGKTTRIIRRATRQYYDARGVTVFQDRLKRNRVVSFSCGVFKFGRKTFVKIEVQGRPEQVTRPGEQITPEPKEDLLSGLPDEGGLLQAVGNTISSGAQAKAALSLIHCKIKPGKEVEEIKNIQQEEKKMFSDLAEALQSKIRQTDTLARLSHYEFGVLLPKTSQERANVLIKRLTATLEKLPVFQKGFYEFEFEMAQLPPQAFSFMHLLHSREPSARDLLPKK